MALKTCIASLLLGVVLAETAASKVGDTLEQTVARYGEEQPLERTDSALFKGSRLYAFSSNGLRVVVEMLGGKAVATTFCREKSPLEKKPPAMARELIDELLSQNGDGAGWQRVAASTTISQWARRDGQISALYDPLAHYLVLSSTKVDDSVVEGPAPKPIPKPVARAIDEPSSDPAPISLPDTLTVGRETYRNPVYRSHNDFLLKITHETGVASLLIEDLPPAIQKKLNYDPKAAEASQKAEIERQRQIEAKQRAEKEEAAAERKAAAQRAAELAAKTPQIATSQDVKDFWIRASRRMVPREMAHDHYRRKQAHEDFVGAVSSGYFDDEAQRQALEWNKGEYQRVGDLAGAEMVQKDLSLLLERMEKQRELAESQAQTEAMRDIATKISGIRQEMRDIEWRSRNW